MPATRPMIIKKKKKQNSGKGFSREELKKAGSSLSEAARLKIPVDPRRKTIHEENVQAAKSLIEQKKKPAAAKKPKKKPKS